MQLAPGDRSIEVHVCHSLTRELEVLHDHLLGLFAAQAAVALDLLQRAREAEAALGGDGRLAVVARVAAALESREDEAGARLLAALEEVLR